MSSNGTEIVSPLLLQKIPALLNGGSNLDSLVMIEITNWTVHHASQLDPLKYSIHAKQFADRRISDLTAWDISFMDKVQEQNLAFDLLEVAIQLHFLPLQEIASKYLAKVIISKNFDLSVEISRSSNTLKQVLKYVPLVLRLELDKCSNANVREALDQLWSDQQSL